MNFARKSLAIVASAFALCSHADVHTAQTITLKYGWNTFYVEVAPGVSPDVAFASWPVKSIGFYDPAAFLATRQFSAGWDSQGVSMNPVAMWHRDYPEASQAKTIPAGTVCLAFSTNLETTAVTLVGVPAAPRMTWHVTDTNEVYNFVGFSLQEGASISPGDYLEGFDGEVLKGGLYKLTGKKESSSPKVTQIYDSTKVSDGDVLLVASSDQSDWSGVLNVSPIGGIDFGKDGVQRTLSIRNDGEEARTVAVSLESPANAQGLTLEYGWLHIRDAAVARTNAQWQACAGKDVATKRLVAGETWRLQFGLDRKALAEKVQGLTFGMVLRIIDVDGKSKMRVDVPLAGTTSGGYATARMWPSGLWIGEVALDSVRGPSDKVATATGGTLKLRLPLHVDAEGKVRLLQRAVMAGTVEQDGTYDYHIYAGAGKPSATENVTMRVSAVCLPTETPVVLGDTAGLASGKVAFKFTVAGDGATSLLRHPYHPQHDGLKWDFSTPAPSGDNIANYKYDIKPETFSVENEISLDLAFNGGEAAWNPEESVSGTCSWSLSGLMRQGAVVVSGPMTLKRVSPKAELILE